VIRSLILCSILENLQFWTNPQLPDAFFGVKLNPRPNVFIEGKMLKSKEIQCIEK